jgi:uncharacterized membrane protein
MMSTLVTLAYPNKEKAHAALELLQQLQVQQLITLDDAVVAHHEGDKIKLDQAVNLTRAGAASGALWGGLFGLIFLVPIVGIAAGAAGGALSGKLSDYGVDDAFARRMQEQLGPGKSALVLLIRRATPDRVISEMKEADLGGEIIQTSMSEEDENRLREEMASA